MYEFASCVAITIICYGVAEAIKKANFIKEKYLPSILLVLGAILGYVAYFIKMPSFPANDIITALAVGIYSSMMAVGINQVFKQRGKDE
jgi:hypothetical protein